MNNTLGHESLLPFRQRQIQPFVCADERPPVAVAGVMISSAAAAAEDVAGERRDDGITGVAVGSGRGRGRHGLKIILNIILCS
jgi:hypothetical protein